MTNFVESTTKNLEEPEMASGNATESSIASLDNEIAKLLEQRFHLLRTSGLKGQASLPAILKMEVEAHKSVANEHAGSAGYCQIMRVMNQVWLESRQASLVRPTHVACLGPAGTYSHLMAMRVFGKDARYELAPRIDSVIDLLKSGRCVYAIVPIMNSVTGAYTENLELLHHVCADDIEACGDAELLVQYALMGRGKLSDVNVIYTNPQAMKQCRQRLDRIQARRGTSQPIHFVDASSTADAARLASRNPETAAIVHRVVGQAYGLNVLQDHIEDEADNSTRFLILRRTAEPSLPSDSDQTLVFMHLADGELPGRLFRALEILKECNLTCILSWAYRPMAGMANLRYVFYLEVDGHISEPKIASALDRLKDCCELGYPRILGSFAHRTVLGAPKKLD